MNIKNLTFTALASILISTTVSAQTVSEVGSANSMVQLRGLIEKPKNSVKEILSDPTLTGSPYYNEEFVPGKIIDSKNNRKIDVYLRYRILDDVIQVKADKNAEIVDLARSNDFDAVINDNRFSFYMNYPITINGTNSGYSIELTDGEKAILLKRISQEFIPGKKPENSYSNPTPPKLDKSSTYFVIINDEIREIEAHKKKVLKSFDEDEQDVLKSYIKDNKLKFRGSDEEADLIALIKYYNSL